MLVPFSIDYVNARKALVAAIVLGTGLANNRIVREQAQGPVQPPLPRPYASFVMRMAAMRTAFRDSTVFKNTEGNQSITVSGYRGLAVDVTFHGQSQDDAYGLASTFQASLYREDVLASLRAVGFAVWTIQDVTDLTSLLNTGFEARAMVEFEMWTRIVSTVAVGDIQSVPLVGNVQTHLELTT